MNLKLLSNGVSEPNLMHACQCCRPCLRSRIIFYRFEAGINATVTDLGGIYQVNHYALTKTSVEIQKASILK